MTKVFLAPLAGITDAAMREVALSQGAFLTYTEMISAKGLSYNNQRTQELLHLSEEEKKVGVQLFGSDPTILCTIAKQVEDTLKDRLYVIDINMGCPAPKITKNKEGAALMKDIKLAAEIISQVKKSVNTKLSVKFRKGYDEGNINAVEFAKMAQDNGADIITIHGRTASQFYSGKADLDIIAAVAQSVTIEVIGNGDIFSPIDAQNMLEYTKCDHVMVARGAIGNPFIFKQINELLQTGIVKSTFTIKDKLEMCLHQARLSVKNKGEYMAMRQMRTHAAHYIKGIKNAANIRSQVVKVNSYKELEEIFSKIQY